MEQDTQRQLTLAEAAAETGLDAAFLDWALTAGLLEGTPDANDGWHLPYAAAKEATVEAMGADAAARPPLAESQVSRELEVLRRQLAERDTRLAEKDRVIADLGRSLARLGDAAAQGLAPRDKSHR